MAQTSKWLSFRIVLLLGFLAHLPMLWNGFTYYSDDVYVLDNPLIHGFSGASLKALFTTYFDGHYHPLTLLSLAISWMAGGTAPLVYQLADLSLHLLSCWLLYNVLKSLKINPTVAAVAVLVFAIHPLSVESVARISERKDTQYVFFLLAALLSYLHFYWSKKPKFYLLSVLLFLCACLSKGQAMVFPALLYAIEWYFRKTEGKKINHLYIIPLFALSAITIYFNYRAQVVTGYLNDSETWSFTTLLTDSSYILVQYILKLFAPFRLSAQYPAPEPGAWLWIFPVLLIGVLLFMRWLYRRKQYLALLGILWYLIAVVPMLRLVPNSENFMADRYNYLGLAGFGIFAVAFWHYLAETYRWKRIRVVPAIWLTALAIACFARTTVWESGLTIWSDAYTKYPEDPYAANNYAGNLTKLGGDKLGPGLDLYRKSIALAPEILAHRINYMNVLKQQQLEREYLQQLKIIVETEARTPNDKANKANILLMHGYPDAALAELNTAIAHKPEYAKLRLNRAGFFFNQFRFDEALQELDTALNLCSNYLTTVYLLKTEIYICRHQTQEAQQALNHAKALFAPEETVKKLQHNLTVLAAKAFPVDPSALSDEELLSEGSFYYYNKLYYHAWVLFNEGLQRHPNQSDLLNNAMACSYNLARPDLAAAYMRTLRKNEYILNQNAQEWLKSLGIEA